MGIVAIGRRFIRRVERAVNGSFQTVVLRRFDFLRCPAKSGAIQKMRGGFERPLLLWQRCQHLIPFDRSEPSIR